MYVSILLRKETSIYKLDDMIVLQESHVLCRMCDTTSEIYRSYKFYERNY